MHLLEFCAAAPFTCFYVCLILFSFLFCLQLFTCIPARCSKIYQRDFQRFFSYKMNHNKWISPLLVEFVRKFSCLWEFYYPWSLDLRKCSRLKEPCNEDTFSKIQVSFSYFLIYLSDILITFETYCLLKASMNFLILWMKTLMCTGFGFWL